MKIDHSRDKSVPEREKMQLWRVTCNEKSIWTVQGTTYDKDGKVIRSFENEGYYNGIYSHIIPDSVAEGFWKAVCWK